MTDSTQESNDDLTDAARVILNEFEADVVLRALDVLGWKVTPQDGSDSRWPLYHCYDTCPAWCENGDEDLPVSMSEEQALLSGAKLFIAERLRQRERLQRHEISPGRTA